MSNIQEILNEKKQQHKLYIIKQIYKTKNRVNTKTT